MPILDRMENESLELKNQRTFHETEGQISDEILIYLASNEGNFSCASSETYSDLYKQPNFWKKQHNC